MGKSWTLVGESGAGQIAKAANQIMVGAQMVAMGELMVFAQKCGVDPFKVVEAIKGGAARRLPPISNRTSGRLPPCLRGGPLAGI